MSDGLGEARLRRLLAGDDFVRRLVVLDRTGSTNEDLRRLGSEGAPEGTVVAADHQTAGRGRLGRAWHSSPKLSLCISVLFRPSLPLEEIPRFTLGASVAAARACRSSAGASAEIRWPNDVFVADRKIAGILAEVRSTGTEASELVVGTGWNVNQERGDFPEELGETAGSLRMAMGRTVDREALAAAYVRELGSVARALAAGRWEEISAEWTGFSPRSRGCRVRVVPTPGARDGFLGVTRGIDATGALRVERPDRSVALVRLGESVTFP